MDKFALKRFFLNKCSDSEREEIVIWLLNPHNDLLIKIWMKENWDLLSELNYINTDEPDVNKIWLNIQKKIEQDSKTEEFYYSKEFNTPSFSISRNYKKIISIAAIFLFIIFSATFLIKQGYLPKNDFTNSGYKSIKHLTDVTPPNNSNAILILANGKRISLNNSIDGVLAQQGMVNVTKDTSGNIIYTGDPTEKVEYNTISLPKGSKPLHLILADKSGVWINAASSITYPTAFIGKERIVKVNGEVYFEVAKNALMPFFVSHDDLEIKVLGTHFNVNTYADEKISKITLTEGSITLSNNAKTILLKPGEQAQLYKNEINVLSEDINIDEVMAWKDGLFYYEGVGLKTIMRQVEKYYNVDIEYKDNLDYKIFAKISRQVKLSEFLKKLELTNLVHFKIEANKIIVMK
jgi:hypothetical protein